MSESIVTVATASRLHFGLLSFGNPTGRQYGGVGVMVDGAGLELIFSANESLEVEGPFANRVTDFALEYAKAERIAEPLPYRIEVRKAPRQHVGLGTGTQLGLAVASGLDALRGQRERDIEQLATLVGRGRRSAIGAHGFVSGGLLYEEGKLPDENLASLTSRVELPSSWRFVLFCETQQEGLSGSVEGQSFAELPPVSMETTESLRREAVEHLLPAAEQGELETFGESLYRYGQMAGMCFSERQGGPYATPKMERLVDTVRHLGVRGVGQSSWGPTIFALVDGDANAKDLAEKVQASSEGDGLEAIISPVRNSGASISVMPATSSRIG